MKRVAQGLLAAGLPMLPAGCLTSHGEVRPTTRLIPGDTLCVTTDSSNRFVAQDALMDSLARRGLQTRLVPSISEGRKLPACRYILFARTVSKWDWANYTREIHYALYVESEKVAYVDFFGGEGYNPFKYRSTAASVDACLDALFPNLIE